MLKAFAYLRVSGKGQVEHDGFPRQLLACQSYADANDIEIVEVFREEGVSGTKELDNRPALSELFAALEENGIKTVICERLDRFARDLMIQETILGDMAKRGYTLVSTAEPDLCSSDPSRVLIRQIFGALAQWDRAMITLKLMGARKRKKAAGGKGEGSYAYGTDPKRPDEVSVLADMRRWQGDGIPAQQIAARLNDKGIQGRSGCEWKAANVAKILRRVIVSQL